MHRSLVGVLSWVRSGVLGITPLVVVGCLDDGGLVRPAVEQETPSPSDEPAPESPEPASPADERGSDFSRAMGSLEAEAGAMMDEAALVACADTGNLCFEEGTDPVVCISDYVTCVVAGGLPADHPYLVCLGDLSSCWSAAGDDEGALDTCFYAYDSCLAEVVPTEPTEPTEPTDPRDPPTDPGEAALLACEEQAGWCFERVGEEGVDEATCSATYRDCIVAAGVPADEPYVVCIDQVVECLAGDDDEACWGSFEGCVDAAYPYEPEPHEPDGNEPPEGEEEYEYALCEEPTMDCYEAGGSNVECMGVYRSCLLDEGYSADDPGMVCLDALIVCAGPAEASADPDAALEVCAREFDTCVGYPEY